MVCLPVRGENPRALAAGLFYVQVDNHGITILYHRHQYRPCTLREIILLSKLSRRDFTKHKIGNI